jgi:hypothetical protein
MSCALQTPNNGRRVGARCASRSVRTRAWRRAPAINARLAGESMRTGHVACRNPAAAPAIGTSRTRGVAIWPLAMLTVNADSHSAFQRVHKPGDEKRMVDILDPARVDRWLM